MGYFTDEYDKLSIKNKIQVLEQELSLQYNNKRQKEEQAEEIIDANNNALDAMFDGLKVVTSIDNPIPFTSPMKCYTNVYYSVSKFDGLKNVVKIYVCMPEDNKIKNVIVTDDNFDKYMVEM